VLRLPHQLALREVLVNDGLIVRPQLLRVEALRAAVVLRVEVELVELKHPLQHVEVALLHELSVGSSRVPRVCGVEADHRETRGWD